MTEIYLIRHTQAEGNRWRMMQGFWDGEVTALGLRQADALGRRFANIPLDAVYSSDLSRAVLTAEAVAAGHGILVQTRSALRELNIGPWEKLFFGNLCHEDPALVDCFMHDSEHWHLEGAETYAQVRERGLKELRHIAVQNEGKTIAVVSHGVTIRCILSGITGYPLSDTEHLPICKNTAVTRLLWQDGQFAVDYMNDDSHLEKADRTSWNLNGALRDVPFEPVRDRAWYEQCYADSWMAAHGDLTGFSAPGYYSAACRHLSADPGAVRLMYLEDEPAGLVDLNPERGKEEGIGWISLLYLTETFRNRGYGIQLLARAISFYRGRRCLRLQVAEENRAALAFYSREGFYPVSGFRGSVGRLLVMERPLKLPGGTPVLIAGTPAVTAKAELPQANGADYNGNGTAEGEHNA